MLNNYVNNVNYRSHDRNGLMSLAEDHMSRLLLLVLLLLVLLL